MVYACRTDKTQTAEDKVARVESLLAATRSAE
jgi:hypothetical protein